MEYVLGITDITKNQNRTRYSVVYRIGNKQAQETGKLIRKAINFYETQSNKKVVSVMSDRGGEFIAQEHLDWLEGRGTIVTTTPGYTPELNGAAEIL